MSMNCLEGGAQKENASQAIPFQSLTFICLWLPAVKMILFATVARKCNISNSQRGKPKTQVRLTPSGLLVGGSERDVTDSE